MTHPARDELAADEVVVEVWPGAEPDALGRLRFSAYWLDEMVPSGVRGQVFHSNLDEMIRRDEARGLKVTMRGKGGESR